MGFDQDLEKTEKNLHTHKVISFDQWVSDNNPDSSLSYGKGWWDYIEFVRLICDKFDCSKITVVSTYIMETPPPTEKLLMPVISLEIKPIKFIMKTDFGVLPPYWTISVIRDDDSDLKTYGIFNPEEDLRGANISGFSEEWIFPPYSISHTKFTCQVDDEWDVYALIKIIIADDREKKSLSFAYRKNLNMTKKEILHELIKIHEKYSSERYSDESSQMCTMWSTDDPPDILEDTEPLEAICNIINKEIDEDYAVEIYDMNLKEAATSLYDFFKRK